VDRTWIFSLPRARYRGIKEGLLADHDQYERHRVVRGRKLVSR
jgi:hypothetical protein